MQPRTAILCTFLYTVADLIITTFQHSSSSNNGNLTQDQSPDNFLNSLMDVVGISLLRGVLLSGGLVAVTNYGPCKQISLVSFLAAVSFVCSLAGTYALVELLLYSDIEEAWDDSWFWKLLIGTSTSYITALCFWWLPHLKAPGLEHQGTPAEERMKSGESLDRLPDTKQATINPSMGTVTQLLSHCKPDATLIGFAFIFLVGSTTADIFSPYYAGLVVDGIVVQKSLAQVADSMGFLTIVSLGCAFSIGARVYLFSTAYTRLNLRIRQSLFDAVLSQEIGFFDENHTGDIISRLIADTAKMSDVITESVNVLLRSVVKIIGIVIMMFHISWQLSLITILGFPIIMLVSKAYGNYYKKLAERVQSAYAEANNIAVEVISAMKTVRSFANEETESRLYREKLDKVNVFRKKEVLASTFFTWSAGLAQLVLQFSVVCFGAHLVISHQMSSGNLVSFIVYVFLLGDCMRDINYIHTALMQGVGAAEKVFQFLERKPLMVYDGTLAPEHLDGEVEFKDVTFAYPTRPSVQVLKNVSFKLHPGKVTALVGPSGSGKSSCVNILEHFYPLQEGEVLLDGHPISRYDHKYLRRKVALVSQEPVLFSRSIHSNILYGLDLSPNWSVVEAAQKANAHTFVSELPEGYNTEAGEKGAQLSGGQKQRVAIARALIRNPRVLILDEATSALDAESEHVIQQALSNGLQGQTVLVVAHRLNTVEKAHHIIVLDKGQVVQQGTHTKLMEEGGLYSTLVQRQFLVRDPEEVDIEDTTLKSHASP